jgi:Uma2 family endonuclease
MTTPQMTARIFAHAERGPIIGENPSMPMAQKAMRWTRADLQRLPDDGNKYEVVRGELFVTPAPSSGHQEIISVLAQHITPYVQAQALGRVHQARSVVVIEGSEVEPDLYVRPTVPLPPPSWKNAPRPILVVEVLSNATRRRDQIKKRSLYMDARIAEYWIVDRDDRSIRIVRPDQDDILATDTLRWHPTGAADPLELDVAGVFREALG